jgi:hypothetical protein
VWLHTGKVSLLDVQAKPDKRSGEKALALSFRVRNLKTSPEKSLEIELNLTVTFEPAEN